MSRNTTGRLQQHCCCVYPFHIHIIARYASGCCRYRIVTVFVTLQEIYERKRHEAVERDGYRFQQMEAERQTEEARMHRVRELGLKGKTNKSSEHFNIINLNYHHTPEGDKLRYKVRLWQLIVN